MSQNINKTKVDTIKEQVYNLIADLKNTSSNDTEHLQDKYNHLYTTSKTLFNFIIKEHNKTNFNKELFDRNLNQMLSHISRIQKDEISQNDASENIGQLLAKQFIPQCK